MLRKLTIPLNNLQRDTESVLILGDARIIPPTKVSNASARDFYFVEPSVSKTPRRIIRSRVKPKFFLEIEADVKEDDPETIRPVLDRALVVFKLFKNDPLLSSTVFVGDSLERIKFEEYLYYVGDDRLSIPQYHLTADEEEEIKSFWKDYSSINTSNFAVCMFHLADFGPYLRPSFVNYVESLEYLLVPDSDEGEIGYKFASRGALILGERGNREETYDRLKAEYGLRSALVHGNDRKQSECRRKLDRLAGRTLEWNDLLSVVRCDARLALQYFFKVGCLDRLNERRTLLRKLALGLRS